jgi:1-acyl-sn-glycerol-3-phosphate acyltransferase
MTVIGTLLLPLLLPLAALVSLFPASRGALPTFGFLLGYLWCESIGILCSALVWLCYRDRQQFLDKHYALQAWWSDALKTMAERLFRLKFDIKGQQALNGPAAIVIPRHTSIADTIIPMACYATPRNLHIRYVLKKELLWDPCLDIVGNRLPNIFIDRDGPDTELSKSQIRSLMVDLAENEGALIYPEGTRYSADKHAALARRFENNLEITAQLKRWPLLLPPRLGGTLALLEENPGKDVLFCAHVGFEGSSHFSNLINGAWISARIRIQFWRVSYDDIPKEPAALKDWLLAQWDLMHEWVEKNQAAPAPAGR